jgi:hypothetical protein
MAQCIGKRPFGSAADAADALDRIRGSQDAWERVKVPVTYYACDVCGKWHLTSVKKFNSDVKDKPKARRLGRRHKRST